MKVLLVNGSPHENGCTARALKEIATTLAECGVESEVFHIGTEPIAGCTGCIACATLHKCRIDDVVNEFVEKAKEFDGFVFGAFCFRRIFH